ncbi:LysE family translocator [Propionicimonas sp.]|uniref:LysE family translocator n=1 Tax=Propionicimonas sp. TaxID=1955623 RepID=UPI0039E3280D
MSHYLAFVLFAAAVAVAPGPDSFLTLRSTVLGGRTRGLWTALGITIAGTIQGVLAATGLGAVITHAEPVFAAIRWAGVCYLVYLGVTAILGAIRNRGAGWSAGSGPAVRPPTAFRQGFLCNITNPKVLAFNLAVLPQFVGAGAGLGVLLAYALTLTLCGIVVLLTIVAAATAARRALADRTVRRGIEGATGAVFLGFAAALGAEG